MDKTDLKILSILHKKSNTPLRKMWAFEHEDIKPDIVCVGKSVGGGIT